jgi:leader peptidase (prepilin peptidase) / N-methyltransferase
MIDLALVPFYWWQIFAFFFGVIIGSFLNVYIYRFNTGKSLGGHSHCLSCGVRLEWYELFPMVSYLVLRGSCRTCRCRIPSRYFWVELLTGLLFMLCASVSGNIFELLLLWVVMAVLIVITVYDLYHFIIPDILTIVLTLLAAALIGNSFIQGEATLIEIGLDVAAAIAGAGFFLFLWVISKGRWLGFGDVKLAVPLGLLVGATAVFSFIVLSFWIGAVISLAYLGYQRWHQGKTGLRLLSRELTMKSAVPFAPFLVASALLVFFAHINVLTIFQF